MVILGLFTQSISQRVASCLLFSQAARGCEPQNDRMIQ